MPDPLLEQVFKLSGVPTYTFVKPTEYEKLLVSLRTPGRGVVIEGPSGIGKTTAVTQALEVQGIGAKALKLTARKAYDVEIIAALPDMKNTGVVIIDDFHRLHEDIQRRIADFLKVLADEERQDTKLVVVGINKAGDSLVAFAPDLNTRIDTLRFEANPDERVKELIEKGERALNVSLGITSKIIESAGGSFYIAQMLSHEACLAGAATERQESARSLDVSIEVVISRVMDNLSRRFMQVALSFASGPKLRKEGRAPYLHILKWLAEADDWSVQLNRAITGHPDQRGSVGQVVEKGYLETFINGNSAFGEVLHFVPATTILAVEDPQFVFFLRNIGWNKFAERVGYMNLRFDSRYDFALSFAGPDRDVARRFNDHLAANEFAVFFDENEQSRILAENIEDYLAPIYRSEATFVICLLGPEYPKRIWTKFESEQFKARFGDGSVIPVWFANSPPGIFDESTRVGGLTFDRNQNHEGQIAPHVEVLRKKIAQFRLEGNNHPQLRL